MAIKTDISFHRGEDVTLSVTVPGEVVTGWGLGFALARGYGETTAFTKTTGGHGISITGVTTFEIAIDDVDTDVLDSGGYVWDVKRTDAGQEAVLAYGKLSLKPNVAA